jgi:hypothetical protein
MERPILFKPEMVQAILEGRKTQTRRIVSEKVVDAYNNYDDWVNSVAKPEGDSCFRSYEKDYFLNAYKYSVDDILWVRERWGYGIDGKTILYAQEHQSKPYASPPYKWKPSIFMPKSACRLYLKIIDIRVERLQDITETGATAEGFFSDGDESAKIWYSMLWDKINGTGNWAKNPWVWVIEFEKMNNI